MSEIYVIHENDQWVEPLRSAFAGQGFPYQEWFAAAGRTNLDALPPDGVFYNRMSASSHTRGHRFAPEQTSVLLAWLERHGRRVINGSRALGLEINKAAQHAALNACGIRTPRTSAAVGRDAVIAAAQAFLPEPLVIKPNRGGTGRGVNRFDKMEELRAFVHSDAFEESLDGVTLVQQYVHSEEQYITRAEFIGGSFFYAVRVDTGGSFELCPSDPCAARTLDGPATATPTFTIHEDVGRDLIERYEAFLAANGIEIGAIEFVTDEDGHTFTYDVNTNTNYNSLAESTAGRYGMEEIARFLGSELRALRQDAA